VLREERNAAKASEDRMAADHHNRFIEFAWCFAVGEIA
jgi:hypothetical protein